MRMRVRSLLCVSVFVAAGALHAQDLSPDALDKLISAALEKTGAPSASVAVVKDGRTVYAKAFGNANIAEKRAANAATRYAVGSISKQFTATALLLEQEQGKLSLDDKVSKYFPDLTRANEVTVRDLLSHISGYEDYAPQDYMIPAWTQPTTPVAILDNWAKKPLNFDPETRWQYSNTNYVLAGEIFEKVSGQKLAPFLKEHIFDPLGMSTASDCDAHSPTDATAYTRFALGPARPVAREASGWYFAAGELCMTPSDLAKWDMAFLAKQILSGESYRQFTQAAKLKDGSDTHYALGLQIGDLHGTPMISHSGEVSGFLAINRVFPTRNVAVIVLSNEDGVNLIGPLSQDIATAVLTGPVHADLQRDRQIKSILEGLQRGEVNRSLFTANANYYFTQEALEDFKTSLSRLGKLEAVSQTSEQLRGGMTHLGYRAQFESKSVSLNVYVMPDGKFEQFLVEEEL